MRHRVGELWIGLGTFHLVLIGVRGADQLSEIVGAGVLNGLGASLSDLVGSDPERVAIFWLFYLGVPMVLTGMVVRWAQRRVGTLPESFGWATVLSALIGWVVVPVSGFPLLLALGGYQVVVARRERSDADLARSAGQRRSTR